MNLSNQPKGQRGHIRDGVATLMVAGMLAAVAAGIAVVLAGLFGAAPGAPLAAQLARPEQGMHQNGPLRQLFLFGLAFLPVTLVLGRRIGPALIARYDGVVLRAWPPADNSKLWAGPRGSAQIEAWRRLETWCFEGAGSGRSPFWRPWRMPDVTQRFSVALLTGPVGVGKSRLAEELGRDLDGSLQLEACASRLAGLWLRLRVKFDDCRWSRARQRSDPWDGGYLADDAAARAGIAAFRPRRATFIVADELPAASLIAAIEALHARRAEFRHPVRLLIIAADMPPALGLQWHAGQHVWTTALPDLGAVTVMDMAAQA